VALTAAQIVTRCCAAAHAPGFITQCGQLLNMVLGDLCRTYDFEIAAKTAYGNFVPGQITAVGNLGLYGSGPYALPADFLRMKDDHSAFWVLPGSGVPYLMIPCDLSEIDMTVQQAGSQSYPYVIATDMSLTDNATPVFYVYAPASGAYPYTIRYFSQMADIATPETSAVVPWFPHQGYLRKKVTAALMGEVDDDRQAQWDQEADDDLREYLKLKDNRSNRATTVKLDLRRFGRSYSNLRNTKVVGWSLALLSVLPLALRMHGAGV
jgi:hypothetical protein